MSGVLKYLLIVLCVLQLSAFASYNDIYIAEIQYDWIKKTDIEKESIINEVHDMLFSTEKNMSVKDNLKIEFQEKIKDKDRIEHYMAASAGHKAVKDYNISAFYYKNNSYIYMYALQDKKDTSKAFYYDALGKLRYIDFIHGEYPDYPYFAYQYNINGKPISAIYFVAKDTQYVFNPDGSFKGVWYKHNLYDKNSKVILKRSVY